MTKGEKLEYAIEKECCKLSLVEWYEQMGVYTHEVIGWLQINESTKIAVYKKMPNRFHRMMAKLLLGWVYEEGRDG